MKYEIPYTLQTWPKCYTILRNKCMGWPDGTWVSVVGVGSHGGEGINHSFEERKVTFVDLKKFLWEMSTDNGVTWQPAFLTVEGELVTPQAPTKE